ncbi:hypothetical protein AAEX28_07225 [Lentisphaerota bacterium WC36G]|nr:hypothetical protein LJT99_10090 [Lentisphaerae bacterium WC36]UDQ99309.1 hypothetical protein LJT99_07165 [Lentisphaerae bacterium WC36]
MENGETFERGRVEYIAIENTDFSCAGCDFLTDDCQILQKLGEIPKCKDKQIFIEVKK